jgi:hypothetical protein
LLTLDPLGLAADEREAIADRSAARHRQLQHAVAADAQDKPPRPSMANEAQFVRAASESHVPMIGDPRRGPG